MKKYGLFVMLLAIFCKNSAQEVRNDTTLPVKLTDHCNTFLNTKKKIALTRVDELCRGLKQSKAYNTVSPDTFIVQLKERIAHPYGLNQGKTSFCWAAVPIAYLYDAYPVSMAEAVVGLYSTGVFGFVNGLRRVYIRPEQKSIAAIGTKTFAGVNDPLAGKVVDQMVFMAFADKYKCWLNVDRKFNPGDQEMFIWAGSTLAKEKKVWKSFNYNVEKHGFDLYWHCNNKGELVKQAVDQHKVVVLYVNWPYFSKKWDRLRALKRKPPYIITASHFLLVKAFNVANDQYCITFWDDDGLQQYTISHELFQRSVYGLTIITEPFVNLQVRPEEFVMR